MDLFTITARAEVPVAYLADYIDTGDTLATWDVTVLAAEYLSDILPSEVVDATMVAASRTSEGAFTVVAIAAVSEETLRDQYVDTATDDTVSAEVTRFLTGDLPEVLASSVRVHVTRTPVGVPVDVPVAVPVDVG